MNVYEKLSTVQSKLKVSKENFNSFGNYKYRSCEDILEGAKPILKEVSAIVTLTDTVELIGDRFYIKATATFIDTGKGDTVSVNAFAREDATKKGMDLAQVTGSVSSYARKYALNGLFCIDDTKDSDSTNKHGKDDEGKGMPPQQKVTVEEAEKTILKFGKHKGKTLKDIYESHDDYVTWFMENGTDENIKTLFKIIDEACNAEMGTGDNPIAKVKLETLKNMLKDTRTVEKVFLKFYHIDRLEDMTISVFNEAMKALEVKKEKIKKTDFAGTPFSEDLGI